jgi:peptide/nickel transport system ATP-binding protein/oligopeptide transport system ATP-binding protein
MALLEIEDLKVRFRTRYGPVTALDGVSMKVDAGETLGVVGESGCGKSITALSVMGLVPSPPGWVDGGSIRLDGEELTGASDRRMRALRGAEMAMIFQEPMTSLNPVFTAGDQIAEAIMLHQDVGRGEAFERAVALLDRVGIPEARRRASDYPHQLSGGMRQRVMIAMAVSCQPKVLIADEPTTALDVTVQAQIFELLNDIQREFGTAIILITHDMGAIAEMADRVAVMYAGRVIEEGVADAILDDPLHPYSRGLIACIPALGKGGEDAEGRPPPLAEIPGVVPPLHLLGDGCAFKDRCAHRFERCDRQIPPLAPTTAHPVACHAAEEGRI